jgi:putative ABC transport system permease protein
MLKNYIKIALRNIIRQKGYSLINIASLSIGFFCCILILLYIRYELSYDKYHNDAQYIYRVVREHQGEPVWYNSSEHPLAASLKRDFPEIIKATRVKKNDDVGLVEYNSKRFNEKDIYFVDPDFLEIFTFPLVSGDMSTALKEPFSVLITQEMAEKYFGKENPLNKVLRIKEWYSEDKHDYEIKGVLKNIPENSHFTFDFLISYNTLYSLKKEGRESIEIWSYYEPKTYITLQPHANPKELEEKFPAFLRKYKGDESASERIHLQPLIDIHLGGNLRFELETNSDLRYIYLFSAIAFFIMLIACLNYVNLSVARSTKRAVEVGMRKAVGAHKSQLVRQFIVESVVLSLLALLISFLFVDFALKTFSSLIERNLQFSIFKDIYVLLFFTIAAIIVGIFSGSYPAFFLSSFQPSNIIKGNLRVDSKGSAVIRNSLVVIQFASSIALIICTFVIHNQLSYLKNTNLGFDKEQIITIYAMDRNLKKNSETFKNEMLKNPQILGVTASLDLPITIHRTATAGLDKKMERQRTELYFTFIDDNFFNVFDIPFAKGRNFSKEFSMDEAYSAIINETAAKNLGWQENPVGKRLYSVGREWTVIGVIKDFHFHSLHWKIEPLVFIHHNNQNFDFFSVKISPTNITKTISYIEKKWEKFSPEFPFEYTFLDERIDKIYKAEQKLAQSFNIFTFIAVFIACLGLIGLAAFILEQKKREIAIRKVFGASISNIFLLLTRKFTKWVLIANIIAWPVAYYAMSRWLEDFAYRIHIELLTFIMAAVLALIIALITVSYHTLKAAYADPVKALRYE